MQKCPGPTARSALNDLLIRLRLYNSADGKKLAGGEFARFNGLANGVLLGS